MVVNDRAEVDAERRLEHKAEVLRQLKTLLAMIKVFLQRVQTLRPQTVVTTPKQAPSSQEADLTLIKKTKSSKK